MNHYEMKKPKQMELLEGEMGMESQSAKRVNIVSLKMVFRQFLAEADRNNFVVICLDSKSQPTAINICHVGSFEF